jgi:hypothetical protein
MASWVHFCGYAEHLMVFCGCLWLNTNNLCNGFGSQQARCVYSIMSVSYHIRSYRVVSCPCPYHIISVRIILRIVSYHIVIVSV